MPHGRPGLMPFRADPEIPGSPAFVEGLRAGRCQQIGVLSGFGIAGKERGHTGYHPCGIDQREIDLRISLGIAQEEISLRIKKHQGVHEIAAFLKKLLQSPPGSLKIKENEFGEKFLWIKNNSGSSCFR